MTSLSWSRRVSVGETETRAWRRIAAVLPRVEVSLCSAFRQDALLLWTVIGLTLAMWVPLFLTPFLPFADQGINTACADLLWDTARGRMPLAHFHAIQWAPIPYWTVYALAGALGLLFGPLIAAKVVTAMVMAVLPLGIMRLLLTLRRDPRLALWAFALSWEHNLYSGWLSMLQGVGLACFVLAWTLEAGTVTDGLRVAPFAALLALTHVQATWLLGAAVLALAFTRGPTRHRLPVHAVVLLGAGVTMLPWAWEHLGLQSAGAMRLADFSFEWHTPEVKLTQFFTYTLDVFAQRPGARAAAITYALLVIAPMALGLLPQRQDVDRWSLLVMLGAVGALYAFLPFAMSGPGNISIWYAYPRFATVILSWLLLIPRPRLRGVWAIALLPGVAAALLLDVNVCRQFASFGQRTRPFLEIVDSVPRGASVISVVLDDADADPDMKVWPFHQFYGYVTAFNHGYTPYLWGSRNTPLVYRTENSLPAPFWDAPFSLDVHGNPYDYILVQGVAHGDPIASAPSALGLHPTLVKQVDRWRLYKVH